MKFLNKNEEELLRECLGRSADFPAILAEKLKGASPTEDNALRSCIKVLCNEGYFSKLGWGDNVPYIGRIEQKGYEYFHNKDVYIRAKLRQDPYFSLLDEESENILLDLIRSSDNPSLIRGNVNKGRILEYLSKCGYIQLSSKELQYAHNGTFFEVVSLTQKGYNYFCDKANRIEEIIVLGDDFSIMNQIDRQYNVSGNTITSSPFQVGDNNIQNMDCSDYEKELSELKNEIASLRLTDDQSKVLDELISKADDGCKRKDCGIVKQALKEMWDFAKQTGSNLLATYLAVKFGLGT